MLVKLCTVKSHEIVFQWFSGCCYIRTDERGGAYVPIYANFICKRPLTRTNNP
jgi:hypothetical protein